MKVGRIMKDQSGYVDWASALGCGTNGQGPKQTRQKPLLQVLDYCIINCIATISSMRNCSRNITMTKDTIAAMHVQQHHAPVGTCAKSSGSWPGSCLMRSKSLTSIVMVCTQDLYLVRSSAASCSSNSVRRATSTSLQPASANRQAHASPMPELAPVCS